MGRLDAQQVIQNLLDHLGIKAPTLASEVDVLYRRVYDIQSGKTRKVSGDLANKIVARYPDISLHWLLTGEGEMLRTAEEKAEEKPHRIESNVRPVLEGEREWVEIPLVPYRARAGVLSGFGDPDWQEGKQTMPVLIDRRLSGDYLLFEVEGDSMDDGSSTSFLEGDVLLCRVCPRGDWQYGIKRRGDTYCVVATDAEGIALKMITKHDKSENTITCHSLNSIYDDYIVSLSDVKGIFYVEELVKRRY
mgnify:CR=1 FL=1